jgi:Cap4 SAVED domain
MVERQARGEVSTLESLLCEVGTTIDLPDTSAHCRCHFVERDGNRQVQIDALVERLAEEVVDYCIPRSRIVEAEGHLRKHGSTSMFTALATEARELFVKSEPSGEGGELLLYLLLENLLRLPQLFCKMPLKTNSKMHVHGVDGVHGKLLDDGTLALYWGESKLHTTVSSAIDECFKSLAPYLTGGSAGRAKRDLLLLRENLDLGDDEVNAAVLQFFDRSRPEAAKVQFRGACLLGFDLADYPEPFTHGGKEICAEVAAAIAMWHKRIGERIAGHALHSYELEVFCLPMPSVKEFRKKMLQRLST